MTPNTTPTRAEWKERAGFENIDRRDEEQRAERAERRRNWAEGRGKREEKTQHI
ncbi:hypothetical protein N9L68_05180 [bacterium]|nr:hypothetical protein [bacterium]